MRAFFQELKKTIGYCRPYRRFYAISLSALLVVDILDVAAPKLIQLGVSAANGGTHFLHDWLPEAWMRGESAYGGMWAYGLMYFLAITAAGYFRFWMSYSLSEASIRIATDQRNRLYGHVQDLQASWHDTSTTGKIMSLATNDMDACRMFWGLGLLLAVDTALYMLFTPVMMFSISWKLTLACALPIPLMPLVIARVAKRIEERFEHVQSQFSTLSDQASESFHGVKVVKSFAAEDQEVERYRALSKEYRKRALGLARVQTLEDPLLIFFIGLMQLIVLGYGGYLHFAGELAVDEFVSFFFYLLRLAFPMMELGFVIALYQRCVVSRRRIEILLDTPVVITDKNASADASGIDGGLELRHLTFKYFPDNPNALSDITLTIKPGQTVAFMGEVGSGKSTILNLIPRLYDPPQGALFIDGKDVHSFPLDLLRREVIAVPQETFLFSETILENIGFAIDGVQPDIEFLKSCARIARVEEDILGFPKQYETMLGERGINLSGGQKQRVAIARALACKPRILLLDDCLSAVDAETEESILRGLREAQRACTCLISSHRVNAIKHADQIVIFDRGRIIEQGTHAELVAHGGWYADLCRKQALEAQIEST